MPCLLMKVLVGRLLSGSGGNLYHLVELLVVISEIVKNCMQHIADTQLFIYMALTCYQVFLSSKK